MSLAEQKSEVRKSIKVILRALSPEEAEKLSRNAAKYACGLPEYEAANVVLAFLSMGEEIKTSDLIAKALDDGKIVAVPRMERSPEAGDYIVFIALSRDYETWPRDRFGIPTPAKDAKPLRDELLGTSRIFVLTPGLAFDRAGNRLGRGKGYYDRFLARARAIAAGQGGYVFACGFCFDAQLMDKVPSGEDDMRVDAIVTESGPIDLHRRAKKA
jgi:5-formyltetrahydrofolate cyclo-ligase